MIVMDEKNAYPASTRMLIYTADYERMRDEIARLREALTFYAAKENWHFSRETRNVISDFGKIARAALEKKP